MSTGNGANALLAGASGLIGAECLRRLLTAPFERVIVAARRPVEVAHPRLQIEVVDFARLDERAPVAARVALCALGTTIKKAGSPEAFRAVDHDAVAAFARWARRCGAGTFVLLSSVGADRRSRNFYLRTKGEVEDTVAGVGFARLVVLRPSLLLGNRAEPRPGEAVARTVTPVVAPLLVGPLRRYRPIDADTVAAAMVAAARDAEGVGGREGTGEPARQVWEYAEIARAAERERARLPSG